MGYGEEIDSGHARLHELGYKQELKRDLSPSPHYRAMNPSIISPHEDILTTEQYAGCKK